MPRENKPYPNCELCGKPAYKTTTINDGKEVIHICERCDSGVSDPIRNPKTVGRNHPCKCGSGKKNKHCCKK